MRNTKHEILKALFAEAKRLGIDQETLREDITPGVINKRLSAATPQEIAKVLVYIHNRHGIPDAPKGDERRETRDVNRPSSVVNRPSYESSRAGLLEEIRDLAIARFGEDYALPLNAFCARFGEPDGFRRMRVSQMKIVKQRLKELQREDPRNPGTTDYTDCTDKRENPNSEFQNPKSEKVIIFQKGRKGFWNQLGGRENP